MARKPRGATRKTYSTRRVSPALRWVGYGVLAVASGVGVKLAADWVNDPATFPVRSVRVEGSLQHVQRDELRAMIEPQVQNGLVQVSLEGVRRSLESLPWIKSVTVRRTWPDKLVVFIEEQVAVARWAGGGLVNPDGQVFKAKAEGALAALPQLRGPEQHEQEMVENFRQFKRLLEPLGLQIAEVSMSERRAWVVTLHGGQTLNLGRQDIFPRLLRFVRVYPRVLARHHEAIEQFDLRYTNGFAVRWREGAEPAAA